MKQATCINCGCTDRRACVDVFGDPCHWDRLDVRHRIGVCSQCPAVARLWDLLKPRGRLALRAVIEAARADARQAVAQICERRGLKRLALELAA